MTHNQEEKKSINKNRARNDSNDRIRHQGL